MVGIESLPAWGIAWVVAVLLVAGFAHGVLGFGFPVIATPLLALLIDYKSTVLILLLPTLAVCLLNAVHGGNLRESIGRFWFMPIFSVLGAWLGTLVLIVAPPEPFPLLLAVILVVYLYRDRIGRADIPALHRHPATAAAAAALAGGIFEATANVALPPLIIYFMILGVSPMVLVQALNACFVAGKTSQMFAWSANGGIGLSYWLSTLPWALLGIGTLLLGQRLRKRVRAEIYIAWLRKFLWAMVVLLVFQFVHGMGSWL